MNDQTAAALTDVLHADRALIGMYGEACRTVSDDTAEVLRSAADDHRRHEALLVEALDDADIPLVEVSLDMRVLMEEHAGRVRSGRDENEILHALMLAERLNSVLYDIAEREALPEELSDLIAEHHADERMHASLIAERTPLAGGHEHEIACMTGGMTDDRNPDDFE
jgi:hypothetical protein